MNVIKVSACCAVAALVLLNGCIFDSKPASAVSSIVYQQSLGAQSNPLDIEFVNETKAFVATENIPYVMVVNPSTGLKVDSISTAAFIYYPGVDTAKIAPSPYATDMAIFHDTLYVMMNRRTIDRTAIFGPGLILLINKNTNAIIDSIKLNYTNPTSLKLEGNVLYITSAGGYTVLDDGAVEAINLSTRTILPPAILKLTLGGRPEHIAFKGNNRWYVETYVGWGDVRVLEADFSTGAVIGTLPNIVSAYGGIFYDSVTQRLYVGESDADNAGLKIFNAQNNTQVCATIKDASGLWPISLSRWTPSSGSTSSKLFIAQSNYSSGLLTCMNASDTTMQSPSLKIFGDTRLFCFGSYIYILEAFGGDNLIKIDCQRFVEGK